MQERWCLRQGTSFRSDQAFNGERLSRDDPRRVSCLQLVAVICVTVCPHAALDHERVPLVPTPHRGKHFCQ